MGQRISDSQSESTVTLALEKHVIRACRMYVGVMMVEKHVMRACRMYDTCMLAAITSCNRIVFALAQ